MKLLFRIIKKIIRYSFFFFIALLIITVILLISISIYLNTSSFSEKATLQAKQFISKKINRLVEIEKIKFKPFPPRLSIHQLKIYGPRGKKEIPFCFIQEIQLKLDIGKIFKKEIIANYLIINDAVINIIDYKIGKDNFPSWKKEKQGKKSIPISFNINKIEVNNMKVGYLKESIPLYFYTPNLNALFDYSKNIKGFYTHLTFNKGKLKIKEFRDWIFNAEMYFIAKKDGLYFNSMKLESPGLVMFNKGIMKDYGEKIFDLDVLINFTGQKIQRWFIIPTTLKGNGVFEGTFKGTFSDFKINGNYFINHFQIFKFRYRYIFGNFIMDSNSLNLPRIYGKMAEGNFEGAFSIFPLKGKSHYKAKASILSSQLEELSKWFKITPILPTAKINLLGNIEWNEGEFKKFNGYFSSQFIEHKHYDEFYYNNIKLNKGNVRFPINGFIRGKLSNYGISDFNASFKTEFTEYELKGDLNFAGKLNLDVIADSSNLREIDLLYHLIESKIENKKIQEDDLWNIKGKNKFIGKVEDYLFDIKFKGKFKGENIWFRNVNWGSVEGNVKYKNRLFNLTDIHIKRKEENITADYAIFNLGKEGFKTDGDISTSIRFNKFEAQELLKAIGWKFPLSGSLFGHTNIEGAYKEPAISCNLTLFNLKIHNQLIDSAILSFKYEKKYLNVEKVIVKKAQSSLAYKGEINIENLTFNDANLSIKNLSIDLLNNFINFEGKGTLSGSVKLSGDLKNPIGAMDLSVSNLNIYKINFGDIKIEGNSNQEEAKIIISRENKIKKKPEIHTFIKIKYAMPHYYELNSELNDFMLFIPIDFIKDKHSNLSLSLSGNINSNGNLDDFLEKKLLLEVPNLKLRTTDFEIKNYKPFLLEISSIKINLPETNFFLNEYKFSIKSVFDLNKKHFISLLIRGDIDIKLIEKILPGSFASGNGKIQLEAKENKGIINYYGSLIINNGSFKYKGFPLSLDEIEGNLNFNEQEIVFQNIKAKGNNGDIIINGSLVLDRFSISNFSIVAEGKGVFFNYPKDLSAYGNFKINWFGTPQASLITGNAELEEANWNKEYTIGSLIEKSNKSEKEGNYQSIKLNINISTKKIAKFNAKFGNAEINLEEKADLYILNTISNPIIMGRADTQLGTIVFLGNEFKISKGIINFINPNETTAQVDFVAESYIKEYLVKLIINGTLDKFILQFTSEPPLPQADIWALLSGENIQPGRIRNIEGAGEEATLAALGSSYIANPIFGAIQKETKKILGLNTIQISPSILSSETNPTAKITINKFITKDISITYSTDLNSTKEQIILIEFKIAPNVIAVASRNEKGYFGLDFRLNKIF